MEAKTVHLAYSNCTSTLSSWPSPNPKKLKTIYCERVPFMEEKSIFSGNPVRYNETVIIECCTNQLKLKRPYIKSAKTDLCLRYPAKAVLHIKSCRFPAKVFTASWNELIWFDKGCPGLQPSRLSVSKVWLLFRSSSPFFVHFSHSIIALCTNSCHLQAITKPRVVTNALKGLNNGFTLLVYIVLK